MESVFSKSFEASYRRRTKSYLESNTAVHSVALSDTLKLGAAIVENTVQHQSSLLYETLWNPFDALLHLAASDWCFPESVLLKISPRKYTRVVIGKGKCKGVCMEVRAFANVSIVLVE